MVIPLTDLEVKRKALTEFDLRLSLDARRARRRAEKARQKVARGAVTAVDSWQEGNGVQ